MLVTTYLYILNIRLNIKVISDVLVYYVHNTECGTKIKLNVFTKYEMR